MPKTDVSPPTGAFSTVRSPNRLAAAFFLAMIGLSAGSTGAGGSGTGPPEAPETYRTPPAPIPQILDTPPTPAIYLAPDRGFMAILEREAMPDIQRLAEPELRLAGVRMNPNTNGPSRSSFFRGITLKDIDSGRSREVSLPQGALISHPQWSPDGSRLAFTRTTPEGIELWITDLETAEARPVAGPHLNAVFGRPYEWMPESEALVVRRVPADRGPPPPAPPSPAGPVVQETAGPTGPVRTYQDLLNNPHDEALFAYYFTSVMERVPLDGGPSRPIGVPGIYRTMDVAPGGNHLLVREIKRPFTYQAPLFTFAAETRVLDLEGKTLHLVEDRTDVVFPPIGRDRVTTGPRFAQWRADAPAALLWVEAMDGGDPRTQAPVRDRVFLLDAPFDREPGVLIDLDQRFRGIDWGHDGFALVHTRWRTASRTKTYRVAPSDPGAEPVLLWDRSYEDRYGDPGSPVTRRNPAGRSVLHFAASGNALFLAGDGASPDGDYPFLDILDLDTFDTERVWQARDPYYERVVALRDDEAGEIITRRESAESPPNYLLLNVADGTGRRLTEFPDPAPQLAGIQRRILTYPRRDGITLSATLITPPGYDPDSDGPLPMLLWAYPREFRDADAASQVRDSPNRFSRPRYTSPLFLLTQGYAVLSGPAMPIIGEGDDEPNDTYIEQLVASAAAAVDKVVEMGVAERDRIAVGGHSYGAFMAANLLAHSDLFRAGIARSGAYNRSLTPFGFQAEPRSYWEARDTYLSMSPFNYADRIHAPILLLHGQEDNNSGTYPMQSERMYQAVAGNGGTARLVMLPHESHGYVARQSVGHVLAEMIAWLDRHLEPVDPERTGSP